MFWRMAGLSAASTASPVETILDKENYTLEELLDEDELIQECKALNGRLINFLRERSQVEQLLRYIVEEAPEGAEKSRTFKFPFIACEIFICEVDIILKTLVEDEELMDLLFSFLEPNRSHSTLLAGHFSKVVICLMLRKVVPFMNFLKAHQKIFCRLVDLIGITSILEVLIRLIGADERMYTSYMDSMQWLENSDVLEMIVDKFKSSDCAEVHANAAEALSAISRCAPPGLAAKISSPSFVGRLFCYALEDSRPKSVLVHSLSVCISLLDPRKSSFGPYHMYRSQPTNGPSVTANRETVEGMLQSFGKLLKLLDVTSGGSVLETTYGNLQPPLGKHRLKIVEFISILLSIGNEAAEKELIQLGAIHIVLDLFFEYPFNNFLHHQVENIVMSCLDSKKTVLNEHLLRDCNLVEKILAAEKNFTLSYDLNKATVAAEGRPQPRVGNIGHITRLSNKLVQLRNNNHQIQEYLQENTGWANWYVNILLKRNATENVYQWACGRPTALHDRNRYSDDDDFRDRDYDVAALASNLSQAFQYGIYSNEDVEEAHASLERDDEDVYFDDESAEVVISSLRLGDEQDSGALFTNPNWFGLEDDRSAKENPTSLLASPSPNVEETGAIKCTDELVLCKDGQLVDLPTSTGEPDPSPSGDGYVTLADEHRPKDLEEGEGPSTPGKDNKAPEWVEWRETSGSPDQFDAEQSAALPNGELVVDSEDHSDGPIEDASSNEPSSSSNVVMDSGELNSESSSSNGDSDGSNPLTPDDPTTEAPSDDADILGTDITNAAPDGNFTPNDDVETVGTDVADTTAESIEPTVDVESN